jgi:FKBP-type peptidyl-prolyl cis-trans isomerase FkpA
MGKIPEERGELRLFRRCAQPPTACRRQFIGGKSMGKLAISAFLASGLIGLSLQSGVTRAETPATEIAVESEEATLYALGQLIARTLGDFQLDAHELDWVIQGVEDGVFGHPPKTDLAAQVPKLHAMQASRRSGRDVIALEGGILVQSLRAGEGQQPKDTDHVQVLYEGMLADGTVFERAMDMTRPATFPVKGVIPCWTTALQAMRVGQKIRLTCPPELAYGARGVPPKIEPNALLVFNIELLNIL